MRVELEMQAELEFGLLQRKHRGDLNAQVELKAAWYAIMAELRSGHPSIWSMGSDRDPDAFVCFYPPLHGHFRKISADKVAIFAFTEMEPEVPEQNDAEE